MRSPAVSPLGQTLAVGGVLVILVAVIYAPVRDHEYLDYDDLPLLVHNPDIEAASLPDALEIAFTRPQASGWVPLATLSHQLDRALFGREAGGALLVNAGLHALATVLLLFAFMSLTGRLGASAFVAGVFAVHPLHVESVAWAIERKDVLSAVFFAALLGLHARHARHPGRYAAPLACLALGLLSKPMLVTAPFVLLLLDYWPLRRLGVEAVREKWAMFVMVAGSCLVTWRAQRQSGAFDFGTALPLRGRIENALDASVAYLADAFWPSGLAAYYPHPGVSLSLLHDAAMAGVLGAITLGVWMLRRAQPWWLVGWLWYLGMLVPVLGLVQVGIQSRADRYTYLPLIGISLALAFAMDAWARTPRRRTLAAATGVACLVALTVVSMPQVGTWRDSRTLYERMRSVHPEAAFPELRLGMVEAIDGDFEAAAPHLDRAYALDAQMGRDAARQLASLARFHVANGRRVQAIRTLRFAIDFARRSEQPARERELVKQLRDLQRG